jgi:hypothetical protein
VTMPALADCFILVIPGPAATTLASQAGPREKQFLLQNLAVD